MANLSNIIKISQANYNTLSTQGSVTIGGVTYTYDSNALYVIEETGQVVPVSGTNDGTNWTTITIDGTTKNIPSGGGGGSGTVTSVGAGTGLSISGTATVNPTVNIASGYKLPTTTEWSNKSTVSGTTSGNNWSAININGTSKNIPQGTVTSARVQAGTGLSSSQNTSQSTTLDTTISIASGYKLPTTSEWNAVSSRNRETFRNYTVSPSTPYFYLYDGSGNLIETIGDDISEAYNPNSPNWNVLFEYFRQQVFKLGAYDMTGHSLWGPYAAAGLFTASDDGKNSFEALSPSVWMSNNLLSYFTAGNVITDTDIDSYKVEIIGPARSIAECTLKITVFTVGAEEYVLQICSRWGDQDATYFTGGWYGTSTIESISAGTGLHISGNIWTNPVINIASGYKLPTTTEWSNIPQGTVTSVSAGTGLSISGTSTVNPTVNVDSNYKLQTNTEWQNDSVYSVMSFSTVAGSSTSGSVKSVRWYVSGVEGITTPYNGMKLAVKIPLAGVSTGGVILSINGNNDADYHPVAYNKNTVFTTHYAVNTIKYLTYDANDTMVCYKTAGTSVTITGVWKFDADYDSNTTTTYGTLAYYLRPQAGETIYRYKFVMFNKDNRLVPLTTTNVSSGTAVTNQTPTTSAFRPEKIYWYNTYTTINAGSAIGGNTLVDIGYNANSTNATSGGGMAVCNFNETVSSYRLIYLCGNYNKTTGLFTLRDAGVASSKNYYKLVPTNSANITLSSYFTEGYDYILLGGTYSSNNYVHLMDTHPMYHFDGTNLLPWDTWNVSQQNTTKYNTSDTIQAQNIRILTQSEYNNLGTKDSNTIYMIKAS